MTLHKYYHAPLPSTNALDSLTPGRLGAQKVPHWAALRKFAQPRQRPSSPSGPSQVRKASQTLDRCLALAAFAVLGPQKMVSLLPLPLRSLLAPLFTLNCRYFHLPVLTHTTQNLPPPLRVAL